MFRRGSRRFRFDATVLADSFLGLSGSLGSGGREVVAGKWWQGSGGREVVAGEWWHLGIAVPVA